MIATNDRLPSGAVPASQRRARLPDGFGTNGVFMEGPQIRHILPWFVSGARMSPHLCPRFPVKVDEGKLWHFCDDPAGPELVWKPVTIVMMISVMNNNNNNSNSNNDNNNNNN